MDQMPGFSRPLFRGTAAAIVEGQERAINVVHPSTAPGLSPQFNVASLFRPGRACSFQCDRREELPAIRQGENMDDFFGIEDLLSQAYEDAVYAALMPA
ncbi:hypothetical protein [Paraburkholderia guartelaensis]|uniref:hypothetical protein n=1 Tax=Paraburkholderia guartelaensis TaxID=2546446 RepID=UPI002AB659BC|nr:hypothetical protein [Paraburkholderia guartelaensis]